MPRPQIEKVFGLSPPGGRGGGTKDMLPPPPQGGLTPPYDRESYLLVLLGGQGHQYTTTIHSALHSALQDCTNCFYNLHLTGILAPHVRVNRSHCSL